MSLQESTSRGTYAQGDLIIKVTSGSFALQIWRCLNETRRHLANFEGSFTEMIFRYYCGLCQRLWAFELKDIEDTGLASSISESSTDYATKREFSLHHSPNQISS